jgi:SWI/SNF-related matrix-associated actin-dependent regulator of chromatin subfamily A-like protein 1
MLQPLKLNFFLRSVYDGMYEDGVSKVFKPIIIMEPSQLLLMSQVEEIKNLLHENSIQLIQNDTEKNFKLEPFSQFSKAKQLLQENHWKIGESIPFTIWQTILDNENKQTINELDLKNKLGDDLWTQMCPYQRVTVSRAVRYQKAFLALSMGCGKTLISLAVSKCFKHLWPVLIICPSSLKYTFKSEIGKWLPEVPESNIFVVKNSQHLKKNLLSDSSTSSSSSINYQPMELDFLILSYSLVSRPDVYQYLQRKKFKMIIMDESHYVKSLESKRSKYCAAISKHAEVCLLLSGTPCNFSADLYQQIKILYPNIYPNFFNYVYGNREDPDPSRYYFAQRYCKPVEVMYRGRKSWLFKGFDRSEELNAVLNTFMIRLKKKDVLPQLPEKLRICITLDPLKKNQEQEIAKLLKDFNENKNKIENKKESNEDIKKVNKEKYMKAFRLTCTYKIEMVKAFIKEQIIDDMLKNDENMKIIIFHHHVVMGQTIETCLKDHDISFFKINQETTSEKRFEYQESFQNTSNYRVALLSIMAASTGLTLTAANTVVFTEILFGPDLHTQAEDRAHRIGQKEEVNIVYLIQPNTTDIINFNLIKKKERESTRILDGYMNHLESQSFSLNNENKILGEDNTKNSSNQTLSDIIQNCSDKKKQKRKHMSILRDITKPCKFIKKKAIQHQKLLGE